MMSQCAPCYVLMNFGMIYFINRIKILTQNFLIGGTILAPQFPHYDASASGYTMIGVSRMYI